MESRGLWARDARGAYVRTPYPLCSCDYPESGMPQFVPEEIQASAVHHAQLPTIDTNQRAPVLVVGMHNSGTSVLTELLHESGVFFAPSMQHHESHFFSIFVNDLLILGGSDNWAKLPLMSIDDVMTFRDTVGPFIKRHWIAEYLQWGYDGRSPWGIKDPRLCILLPLYLEVFPDARVIHIRRNANDVAASLLERERRRGGLDRSFDHWKCLWSEYVGRVTQWSSRCHAYHELEYESLCTTPHDTFKGVLDFLGLPFTDHTRTVLAKVTPSRIGSYQRLQTRQEPAKDNPVLGFLRRLGLSSR